MTILATDNFTRANAGDLGAAWDECTGEGGGLGFDISSNTAIPSSLGSDSSETNNTVTWPADQYSEVTYASTAADGVGSGAGPSCRQATGATITSYRLVGNASGYELIRRVAAVDTSLSSGSGTTFTTGDKLRLEILTVGANAAWTLKKNGVQFASGTDATPIAGPNRAGIAHSSTSSVVALSGWEGGDFAGSGTSSVPLMGQIVT